jgi:hypothetical protein
MSGLLNAVRGAELEVTTSEATLTGKVLGVEEHLERKHPQSYLSLYEGASVQVIPIREILSYRFLNEGISADVDRAMEVLLGAATSKLRNLEVRLDAKETREVQLTYVSSSPVWKASYRMDLSQDPAFIQGWAIVDNASDTDWKDVELSLFVGRPTSFTQPLYQPYYVYRMEIPLAIAGSAEARLYASDEAFAAAGADSNEMSAPMPTAATRMRGAVMDMRAASASTELAYGKPTGEQFSFTFSRPVTLNRHQSAMLPLTQGDVSATKVSILSGQSLLPGQETNPALGVRVTNNTGVALPAGPITVFDDGLYAGDALIDFLPDGAKRFLSYGDNLAVRGSHRGKTEESIIAATISRGVLRTEVSILTRTEYRLVNDGSKACTLLLEHPRNSNEELVTPAQGEETAFLYRFDVEVPAKKTTDFIVEVRHVVQEETAIIDDPRTLLVRMSKRGLPKAAKAALEKAAELRERDHRSEADLESLEKTEQKLVADQARVRENMAAVGTSGRSGAGYQKRLEELEDRLDQLAKLQEALRQE